MRLTSISLPTFRSIGRFELPLLVAVERMGLNAYGKALSEELSEKLGRRVTIGQVSRALNNLLNIGIVESRPYLPHPRVQGQRSRLVFSLTEKGRALLEQARNPSESTGKAGFKQASSDGKGAPHWAGDFIATYTA